MIAAVRRQRRRIVMAGAAALILCALVPPWREAGKNEKQFLGWAPISHPGSVDILPYYDPESTTEATLEELRSWRGRLLAHKKRLKFVAHPYAVIDAGRLLLQVAIVAVFCGAAWILAGMKEPDA